MSLGVKNDSDLRFAEADLGAAAEGNRIRIGIQVLRPLVTTAHMQILSSDNHSLSEGEISPRTN